jgi:PBP1b-binding outer membrane lipoprotein LpoB
MAAILPIMAGCASNGVQNSQGIATRDVDPSKRGPVAGIGIEGQDVASIADQMVRSMLQSPVLASSTSPPQVIIDAQYFTNESSQQFDKNILVDRLAVNLMNAAQGRMVIVSRESAGMVAEERDLKRSGTVDTGTTGLTKAQAGGDYRLRGRITSLDSFQPNGGGTQRLTQIEFQMVDLERGTVVWAGIYPFERFAADNVVYR